MFLYCFWIVVVCMLLLTVGQAAMRLSGHIPSQQDGFAKPPGLMYFISGAWLFGGRYARSLAAFELARDVRLPGRARVGWLLMSALFLSMIAAWVGGLLSLIWR